MPWLCNYVGTALFLDADVLVRGDVKELFDLMDDNAVMVGDVEPFERASVMLFNCGHEDNAVLDPDYIESAGGLHKIQWTKNVGFFPKEWNHLVLYDEPDPNAKLVHFTAGIPVWEQTKGCEHSQEYIETLNYSNSATDWETLMGRSVHVQKVRDFMKERDG